MGLRYYTVHGAHMGLWHRKEPHWNILPVVTGADNMPSAYKLPELWICGTIHPQIPETI